LFGATGDGADPSGLFKEAVSAGLTPLLPDPVCGGFAQESGVDAREDRNLGEVAYQRLYAYSAGDRNNRLYFFNGFCQL